MPLSLRLGAWQLFNVVEDPDESRDLAKETPDLLEELRAGRERYAEEVGVVPAEG